MHIYGLLGKDRIEERSLDTRYCSVENLTMARLTRIILIHIVLIIFKRFFWLVLRDFVDRFDHG